MRIAVTGASGFIGSRLAATLAARGHEIRAITRRPDRYSGAGTPVGADVLDTSAVTAALYGCDVAYYLVHSLDHRDFARRDAEAALSFAEAAGHAQVRRIVYLGGLGDPRDQLSEHLRSRHEVEGLLAESEVPVTTLRAGIVIGAGSASWEIIRAMVRRFPALVVPRWAMTRTQPIALTDAIRYLVGVLDLEDDPTITYEIGGADVLRYVDVLSRVAALEGRPEIIVPAPMPSVRLATALASRALPLVTGVDRHTIRSLLESMVNEVVVRDVSIRDRIPFTPMGYDDAVREARAEQAQARAGV